ncbi:hypothetical protein ACVWY2_006265 [Bradyrhizobium sp. JR6.1]
MTKDNLLRHSGGDAQHRTRNLEIPHYAIAHLQPALCAPRNDELEKAAPYLFKCFPKNSMLRGQAMSALALS